MYKLESQVYKLLCILCGLLILAMTFLIFAQVLCRYIFDNSLTWSEELGRYIFIWITFLGLPAALEAKAHVALDLLLKKLKGKAYRTVVTINMVLTSLLALVITVSGVNLFFLGMGQSSSALMLSIDRKSVV